MKRFTACKNCPDRTVEPNCHMTCKEYLDYKKEREKFKECVAKEAELTTFSVEHSKRVLKATQRIRGKK